jgi:Amt family ammonium transporter
VAVVKIRLGYDDSLDVFGIHGVAGIVGAIGTGILAAPSLGGVGYPDGVGMAGQVWTQVLAVAITVVWCGVVSAILYKLVDLVIGLRPSAEAEAQGLDLAAHGEAAYHG